MEASFTPVEWVYREVIEEAIAGGVRGKIFYFDNSAISEEQGAVTAMEEISGKGIFILLDNGKTIRIDRIITLFGKPGAAYDEYNSYANACMECMGGYDNADTE